MVDAAAAPDTTDSLDLSAPEARVLGSQMEKQLTTPVAYPLTLNALVAACNQATNRDPVVRYEPHEVEQAVVTLKAKGLARMVHPGSGERVTKYRQVADEALDLGSSGRALICVLLLRGAQTVAELKSRTERLHAYASLGDIEDGLDVLARRHRAFTARVERRPGQREERWIQLLEVGAAERAAASATEAASSSDVRASAVRGSERVEELEARLATVERRLAALVEALGDLVDLPE